MVLGRIMMSFCYKAGYRFLVGFPNRWSRNRHYFFLICHLVIFPKAKVPYFVIVTLGFKYYSVAIIENLSSLTEGVNGLAGIPVQEVFLGYLLS